MKKATGIPAKSTESKAVSATDKKIEALFDDETTTVSATHVDSALKKEVLKQTQFNLPVSLNDRIAIVAEKYHAGNKSHFVRAALEEIVSRYEQKMDR